MRKDGSQMNIQKESEKIALLMIILSYYFFAALSCSIIIFRASTATLTDEDVSSLIFWSSPAASLY